MNIKTVTVTYGVKRSRNYQSVDVSLTAEVSLSEGETLEEAFQATMKRMAPVVDTEAAAAIDEIGGGQ